MESKISQSAQAAPDISADKKIKKITIISTIGGLCFGYDTGVISGALLFMSKDLGLTPATEGIITSSLLFGAAMGSLLGGIFSDRYGRKRNMIWVAVIFVLGALFTALAWNVESMLIARFILGIAVGSASVTVPMYIAELAPQQHRERLVTVNELMIVSGQFLAYAVNAGIVNAYPELSHNWRIMLAIPAIPGALLWLGMLFMPESPRYYFHKGQGDKAREVLESLREPGQIEKELREIKRIAETDAQKEPFFTAIRHKWVFQLMLVGFLMVVATRVTGVNTIMYYAPTVLKSTGLGDAAAVTAAVANGFISIVATLIGIMIISKISRRKMFIIGQSGVAVSLALLAFAFHQFFHIQEVNGVSSLTGNFEGASYIVLALMLLFLVFMQTFIGPVFWLMMSEIFPLRIRGMGIGFSIFMMWIIDFFIQAAFPLMLSTYGGGTTFGLFSLCNVVIVILLIKYLPETKGLSLEEIEKKFRF